MKNKENKEFDDMDLVPFLFIFLIMLMLFVWMGSGT